MSRAGVSPRRSSEGACGGRADRTATLSCDAAEPREPLVREGAYQQRGRWWLVFICGAFPQSEGNPELGEAEGFSQRLPQPSCKVLSSLSSEAQVLPDLFSAQITSLMLMLEMTCQRSCPLFDAKNTGAHSSRRGSAPLPAPGRAARSSRPAPGTVPDAGMLPRSASGASGVM